jgi:CRISPR/Cas system-associated protein Cas10 (large subunit of type III CRISPR-Cas system)
MKYQATAKIKALEKKAEMAEKRIKSLTERILSKFINNTACPNGSSNHNCQQNNSTLMEKLNKIKKDFEKWCSININIGGISFIELESNSLSSINSSVVGFTNSNSLENVKGITFINIASIPGNF